MPLTARIRLVLHGAIVILAGLLSGLPTAVESMQGDSVRLWHTAHEALIMIGTWMLATAGISPLIALPDAEARWLQRCLVAMGYAFITALTLGSAIGVSPFAPGRSPLSMAAFGAAVIGIGGAVLAALLTIRGALGALRAAAGAGNGAA